MLGNFTYCNPTRIHFGADALNHLSDELAKYGETILLAYGGGSIKKSGLYDEVVRILKDSGKRIVELSGVMPNPTVEKLPMPLSSLMKPISLLWAVLLNRQQRRTY